MNQAIQQLHEYVDLLKLIPGISGDKGRIVITMDLIGGKARWIAAEYITLERQELLAGELRRVKRRKINVAKSEIDSCKALESSL